LNLSTARGALQKLISEKTRDMNIGNRSGFDGINRFHFLWLWIPLLTYALNMITPMTRFYAVSLQDFFGVRTMFAALFLALPMACAAIPITIGLSLLSNRGGTGMHPVARNLLGFIVIVGGFALGTAILSGADAGIVWLFGK